ncbi:unnamed protein product [Notodromas monacha]|uniref:Uncharacterized protein n=1 Tax=Notodromas monacha TaxID=399045 RepID=A0A7R9BPM6_9CRUS|nr:unnamed protein product [Notodromas monacha]CAG0919365.1 unnamed protein product [Notodromas monacha]
MTLLRNPFFFSYLVAFNLLNSLLLHCFEIRTYDSTRSSSFDRWTQESQSLTTRSQTEYRLGPRFASDVVDLQIWEQVQKGTSIGEVTVSNPNSEKIEYTLLANGTDFLSVDRDSGKLVLRDDPKNVKEGSYEFRVLASSRSGNASTRVKVRVSYSNSHRPLITNCNNTARVREEDTSRPFVFQVLATDEDLGVNGQEGLEFSIVQVPGTVTPSFTIEKETGKIFANRPFDRDEPENERKLTVPIKVVDGGKPPLNDVCVLHIEVTDVNDNKPLFDRVEYEASLPKDTQVGAEVLGISAADIDDGENAVINFSLEPDEGDPDDVTYFRIESGQILLKKSLISLDVQTKLRFRAKAENPGIPKKSETVKVTVIVVEPALQPPTIDGPDSINLAETYEQTSVPIANFSVAAHSDPPGQLFQELLRGQSESTNSKPTFSATMQNNVVQLYVLRGMLDYERITSYNLTISVLDTSNNLRAEKAIHVMVVPMNDEPPIFGDISELVVLENQPPGTLVGTVVATDRDAYDAHNRVYYSLKDTASTAATLFSVNPTTGDVKTRVQLDREVGATYVFDIMASDNYPSAIKPDGTPNNSTIQLLVRVKDVNDNRPKFEKDYYEAEVLETLNVKAVVAKVKANDPDESSELIYSITGGNEEGKFTINERNGEIRIANDLDYEKTTSYDLTVTVSDLQYSAETEVRVYVKNVADEPPKFTLSEHRTTIAENSTDLPFRILHVQAVDPENVASVGYFLQPEDEDTFKVESDGSLWLLKALDRDAPYGKETWEVRVWAHTGDRKDELVSFTTVSITLTDINDNAPYLVQIDPPPLVWEDSCDACPVRNGCQYVAVLEARDNDGPENGGPFLFGLDSSLDPDVERLFRIEQQGSQWVLYNQTTFDREKQKEYRVPIWVSDSPKTDSPLKATSFLRVVIGDCNDNEMFDGYSEIVVMNYKGELPATKIGRVFVEDLDDWDLADKEFHWESVQNPNFILDQDTGDIIMNPGYGSALHHTLDFSVTDHKWASTVRARVNVTVQIIPEEAATDVKSASIRLTNIDQGTFVDTKKNGWSRVTALKEFVGGLTNHAPGNVDVLSVRTVSNKVFEHKTDVRFAVHGSPYLQASHLNWLLTSHPDEKLRNYGCAYVLLFMPLTEIGYALMNSLPACNDTEIVVDVLTDSMDAVLLYNGPVTGNPRQSKDFFSLELRDGQPVLLVNYGDRTEYLEPRDVRGKINDGHWHNITVRWSPRRASIAVDGRVLMQDLSESRGQYTLVNSNGPLQLGGFVHDMRAMEGFYGWTGSGRSPLLKSAFRGCLGNLVINGELVDFAQAFIKEPDVAHGCRAGPKAGQLASLSAKPEFLAIVIGSAVLLILLLVLMVFVRRRHYAAAWEDGAEDHSRDTLGTYAEEGGGEGDTRTYDPSLLKKALLEDEKLTRRQAPTGDVVDPAEIASFLDLNKRIADNGDDKEDLDDMRNYAYEGQDSSVGSLSSLSSCGGEEPVDEMFFSRLHPHFQKLAEMYRGSESDSEDDYAASAFDDALRRRRPHGDSVPPESWC